jgi:hypothetical protein
VGVPVARGECLKTVGVDALRVIGSSDGSVVDCDSRGGDSLYEKLAPPISGISKSAGPLPASTHGRQKT